ncbi:hypothetical protein M3Y94_00460200 [Aphelenchoides besseyi]|nr:hypothetical protein M3Y94_00460200 [Aphelenchoides besseyi]KAI6229223.1 UBX domain-containing protein 6 [Aphelenchoides besseyi]
MNKLKDFLNKKKTDKQFKRAGQGYSLSSGGSGNGGSSTSGNSRQAAYVPPVDNADRRLRSEALAEAHASRFAAKEDKGLTAGQRRIREQARREYEAEQRQLKGEPEPSEQKLADERDGIHEFEHSDQISSVLYTCELIDEQKGLPKKELIAELEKFLQETLSSEPVEASILMIWSLNKGAEREVGISILSKYINNILNAPTDLKFRRIKTSNKNFVEKVATLKGGSEFLKAVGFFEDDQHNPEGGVDTFLVLPDPDEEKLALLHDAILSLEGGSVPPIKLFRDPKFYRVDPNKPIPNPEIPADFFIRSAEELKLEQKQRSEAVEKLTTLRTSEMRERDARLRQYNYKYTLIRIRFPNGFMLQGVFNVHDKFGAVRDFLAGMLAEAVGEFVITDPTTKKRFDDDNRTLNDYGLVPAAVILFEWDEDTLSQLRSLNKEPLYLRAEHEQQAVAP